MSWRGVLIGNAVLFGLLTLVLAATAWDAYQARQQQETTLKYFGLPRDALQHLLDAVQPKRLRQLSGGSVLTLEDIEARRHQAGLDHRRRIEACPLLTTGEAESMP